MKTVGKMTQGELWDDQQSLLQAILVAQRNKINVGEIRRWSLAEGQLEEFEKIKNKLRAK